MVIKVEYNFKLHKFSITIKKTAPSEPERSRVKNNLLI